MQVQFGVPEPPDSYSETCARLDAAIAVTAARQDVLRNQVRAAWEVARHYGAVTRSYETRLKALEAVVAEERLTAGQAVSLAATARRMHDLAVRVEATARHHFEVVRAKESRVEELMQKLTSSKSQLKLAQTAENHRNRLRSLEAAVEQDPMIYNRSRSDHELHEAARLAREAEALAGLKGGWS
ncbi:MULTISPECIES: hypothetical protein [unclassified Arthrobacter]|uniref:hypothetical protein n=1 Tax=unclassified Arthrobacter TaxID=235627 RepID=UPI0021045B92|nr:MULTISPECIES: hypothetical protein [unclassified Arthrobacter]MCQ1987377.1 hypothetical protein [Arthrobacter sp. zg-Y844]MCQ1996721.1 hypothetical protein [Arthrobacter sp. zg-Y1171]UWX82319.1 hypothetical protein N2L00_02465 [Arthrobacter sp. zg-Y1171]